MAEIRTVNPAPSRASAGDEGDPPSRRRKPLDNLDQVRREMAATYWELKHEDLDLDRGKARIYVLSQIVVLLKADVEMKLAEMLEKLKGEGS